MSEIKKQYNKTKEEFEKLCKEISDNKEIHNGEILSSSDKILEQIKEYQEKLYNKFDVLIESSVKRFSKIEKCYVDWQLNNKGFNSFTDYIVEQLNEYIKNASAREEKIVSDTDIGIIVSGVAALASIVTLAATQDLNLLIPFGISSGLQFAFLTANFVCTIFDINYRSKDFNALIKNISDFYTLDKDLSNILDSYNKKYTDLSEKIKLGLTLNKAKTDIENITERTKEIDKEINILKYEHRELTRQQEELENQANMIDKLSGEEEVLKFAKNINASKEEYNAFREEKLKNSKFYSNKTKE